MMNYLYKKGYKTISTEEFYEWYKGKVEYYGKTCMITLDDGMYEEYYLVYPILKKYNLKATSFLIGKKINNITEKYNKNKINYIGLDVINKIRKEYPNFEFQSHSFNIHYKINNIKKIYTMNYQEIEKDFLMNKKFNFSSMAYPYGAFNNEIKILLKKYNFSVAFTFGQYGPASRFNDRFLIPRIKINSSDTLNTLKQWLRKYC